mmetsp:Transcript_5509/g.18618  ORF Transcript_5509/g.18618 Transcript_5509/m.18618 type:complete len:272 (-) Transcript_5509:485-1300(-)
MIHFKTWCISNTGLSGAMFGKPEPICLSEVSVLNPNAASDAVGENEALSSFNNSNSAPVSKLKLGVLTNGEKSNIPGVVPFPLNLLLEGTFNDDKDGLNHLSEPLNGDNVDPGGPPLPPLISNFFKPTPLGPPFMCAAAAFANVAPVGFFATLAGAFFSSLFFIIFFATVFVLLSLISALFVLLSLFSAFSGEVVGIVVVGGFFFLTPPEAVPPLCFVIKAAYRFFTALSVRPPTALAISVHLFPTILCSLINTSSSSGDHPPCLLLSQFK